MNQKVIISEYLEQEISEGIKAVSPDKLFILCDTTTAELCYPVVKDFPVLAGARLIVIGATDTEKNLTSLSHVWEELQHGGATRHSMMINLGGGMVTDLGGFAASTFKRGIHFINIPTTLLAMVDASVGGKTGINFGGLKNEIGVFNNSDVVILDTQFLRTLDHDNICSGYAEMLKHGLITEDESMWAELVTFDLQHPDLTQLQRMLADSVKVKERIVEIDPHEHGIRKALNVGHTIGHAFESFSMTHSTNHQHPRATGRRAKLGDAPNTQHPSPILHGYAVAFGVIAELYLSCIKMHFPTDKMHQTVRFINNNYGKFQITCDDYPTLFELMTHDKKNIAGTINFTLLSNLGGIEINQTATRDEIYEALDFYREC